MLANFAQIAGKSGQPWAKVLHSRYLNHVRNRVNWGSKSGKTLAQGMNMRVGSLGKVQKLISRWISGWVVQI